MITMQETMDVIRKYAPQFTAKVGILLGSGLGAVAEQLTHPITIPYQAIPGLQAGSVAGHASLLVLGFLQDVPVVCLKGRLHSYEGVSYQSICTLIRIVKQLGADDIILTAAGGSLSVEMDSGEIMMVTDQIHFQSGNPLVGPNDESIGPRFPSMENAYNDESRNLLLEVSKHLDIPVREGIHASSPGPSFETPAEIRAYRTLGADSISMSMTSETIIARHCDLRVLGLVAITNLAAGLGHEKVTHELTLQHGEATTHKLIKLISGVVVKMGQRIE